MNRLMEVFCATQRHLKTKNKKQKKRNADKGSHDLREAHERRADPAVGIWKPGRPTEGTQAGMTYGSHTGTGTGPPSTDGQSGKGRTDGPECGWSQA